MQNTISSEPFFFFILAGLSGQSCRQSSWHWAKAGVFWRISEKETAYRTWHALCGRFCHLYTGNLCRCHGHCGLHWRRPYRRLFHTHGKSNPGLCHCGHFCVDSRKRCYFLRASAFFLTGPHHPRSLSFWRFHECRADCWYFLCRLRTDFLCWDQCRLRQKVPGREYAAIHADTCNLFLF